MSRIARKLNLAPHKVADRTLHVAGDIEAHRGNSFLFFICSSFDYNIDYNSIEIGDDGRAYVIDLARLMPAEAPAEDCKKPRQVSQYLQHCIQNKTKNSNKRLGVLSSVKT